uniref:Uncharacterized protein n=1 Tax=Rhizophora mucronata TaxID=61149 RepID=A0A2P2PQ74_RHIMU
MSFYISPPHRFKFSSTPCSYWFP